MRFSEFVRESEEPKKVLVLSSRNKNTAALEAFLDEFDKHTVPNPFFHRMRIWNESVGFELYKFDGMIHIGSIISFDKKNSGNASKGMQWVTSLADKHKVKMDLDVQPIKNAGAREGQNLTKSQLKAWYKRLGFTSSGGDHMMRVPKDEV